MLFEFSADLQEWCDQQDTCLDKGHEEILSLFYAELICNWVKFDAQADLIADHTSVSPRINRVLDDSKYSSWNTVQVLLNHSSMCMNVCLRITGWFAARN